MNEQPNTEELVNTRVPKKNQLGLIGFIVAVAAIVLIWIPSLSEILWLVGLILSVIGITRKPRKFAVAGLITSILAIVIAIVAALLDMASFLFMAG